MPLRKSARPRWQAGERLADNASGFYAATFEEIAQVIGSTPETARPVYCRSLDKMYNELERRGLTARDLLPD